jgi:hypothetical protein
MSVTIKLNPYNFEQILDQEMVRTSFPRSILAQALRDDPETPDIRIENPMITPEILLCLQAILKDELPIPPEGATKAGIYLNIPLLEFMGHPAYENYRTEFKTVRILNTDTYLRVQQFILKYKVRSLLLHIFDIVPKSMYAAIETGGFSNAWLNWVIHVYWS